MVHNPPSELIQQTAQRSALSPISRQLTHGGTTAAVKRCPRLRAYTLRKERTNAIQFPGAARIRGFRVDQLAGERAHQTRPTLRRLSGVRTKTLSQI